MPRAAEVQLPDGNPHGKRPGSPARLDPVSKNRFCDEHRDFVLLSEH